MSIQTFGLDAFRAAVDQALDLAEEAAARVEASDELELLAPVELSVVALRRVPPGMTDERRIDAVNVALVGAVEQSGEVYVSSTRLFGRQAIRMCILNPTTTAALVHRALDIIERTPIDELPLDVRTLPQRHPDVQAGWLTRPTVSAADLAWVPLFACMEPQDVASLLERAVERRLQAGETLIEQWDTTRDVFIILDGTCRVRDGEREIATVGPGDFTGEMAAIDWGAGYGTVRLAQVEAQTPCTLLGLTPELLRDVLSRSAGARELVERTARERLASDGARLASRGQRDLRLRERRPGAEPREDLAGRGEGRCRLRRSAERHQAAPLAEQGVPLFVGHAEVVPADGGDGEPGRRTRMLTASLIQECRRGRECVLVDRHGGFDAVNKAEYELDTARPESDTARCGKAPRSLEGHGTRDRAESLDQFQGLVQVAVCEPTERHGDITTGVDLGFDAPLDSSNQGASASIWSCDPRCV